MLESVRSRQRWGFLILTVLPASAAIGYYLRSRQDQQVIDAVILPNPSSADVPTGLIEDKIRWLKKREARLVDEHDQLEHKLERFLESRKPSA
ncbi:uncharacterized protein JCM15063_002431 [Sporobolomyces koalae]|uniref:uncharacterized protein n=1 Tax=Sporobolomyces koalae TaxID=500713 RepID=UPI0031764E04